MNPTSRRDFLKTAPWLPLGAAALGFGTVSAPALEPVRRTGGPALKVSCNLFCFNQLLLDHLADPAKGIGLLELLDFCAKQNFDGVDVTGYYFPGYQPDGLGVPTDKFIYDLKRRAFDLGLGISGTGVGNTFTTADAAARARDVQRVKNWVEVAAKLGAPVIRVFADTQNGSKVWQTAAKGAPRDQVEAWMAAAFRECADHAAKFGVIIGVQNHGDFIKTAADQISLLKRIDSPWCGAIVDTGKFVAANPYAEITKAAPYAVNWQVKQSPLGPEAEKTAPTDLKRLLQIVRASGYRGYLPIETLHAGRAPYDPFDVVPKFLVELRAALAAG